MRTIPVLVAAVAVLGAAGWLLLRPADAPVVPPADAPDAVAPGGNGESSAAPAPGGGNAPTGSSVDSSGLVRPNPAGGLRSPPLPRGPHVVPPPGGTPSIPGVPPSPLPEGDYGEIIPKEGAKADREKAEATRVRLIECKLGDLDWKDAGLRRALNDIAAKSGIPVEIEGEGVADDAVFAGDRKEDALESLRMVTTRAKLRFEVMADRVIVRK